MDDLISRQPILDSYNRICESCGEDKKYGGAICRSCYLDDAISIVEDAPSAQQWIPCAERLPDQNGKYLVVGRRKAINILKFDGGRWYGKWGVVAWMPLPEIYKGENDG